MSDDIPAAAEAVMETLRERIEDGELADVDNTIEALQQILVQHAAHVSDEANYPKVVELVAASLALQLWSQPAAAPRRH